MTAIGERTRRAFKYLKGRDPVWITFLQIMLLTFAGLFGFLIPYILLDLDAQILADFLVAGSHEERQILLWLLVVLAEGSVYLLGFAWLVSRLTQQYRLLSQDFRVYKNSFRPWKQLALPPIVVLLVFGFLACFGGVYLGEIVTSSRTSAVGGAFPPDNLGGIDISGIRRHWYPFAVALLAVVGMYTCALLASVMNNHRFELSIRVRVYRRLKRQQDQFLMLAGVILGLSILAAALLVRAYNACGPCEVSDDFVYLQSGFFSLGLAIAFVVARHPLRQIGQSLKDEMMPVLDSSNTPQWSDFSNKDQEIDKLLDFSGYSLSSLKEGVAVLAPIIGAAIPLLLKP